MLYTIREVRERLDNMISRYVKVEIDGEIKGVAYMDDLREQAFSWSENGRKRIRKVFLSGRVYDVRIGINLYPAMPDDIWKDLGQRTQKLQNDVKRRGAEREGEVRNIPQPLVSYDYDGRTGIFTIRKDESPKNHESEKPKKSGIFERLKRWIKGDVEYKR